jgi:RNA polymerase sigma factor (sigma-70 family)
MPPEDAELLRHYAEQGSEDAFGELVRRHVDLVYSVALRAVAGDAHLAEDVAQTVFTALARKAGQLAGRPVLAGWLYRTTQFAAIDAVRSESRRRAREHQAHLMHPSSDPGGHEWEKLRPLLEHAIGELDDDDRDAVVLRFFNESSFAAIGAKLRLTENAARMRVERALDKLHAALARRGVTSTAAALGVALAGHAASAAPAGLTASITGVALAASAASTTLSGTTATIALMTTAKTTCLGLAIVSLAGIGFGVYEMKQARQVETSLVAMQTEQSALRARLDTAEQWAQRAEQNAAEAARVAAQAKSADPARSAASGARVPPNAASGDPLAGKQKMPDAVADKLQVMSLRATHPELQRLALEMQRANLGIQFGPLYRKLGLSPQQVAAVETQMVEGMQNAIDIVAAASAKGVSPMDPAIASLGREAKTNADNALRGLLGDAAFQEFNEYQRTFRARELISPVIASMVYSETPLTPAQVDRLTEVVAHNSAGYQKGGGATGNAREVNWDAVVDQAGRFLAPDQLHLLQAERDQRKAALASETLLNSLTR